MTSELICLALESLLLLFSVDSRASFAFSSEQNISKLRSLLMRPSGTIASRELTAKVLSILIAPLEAEMRHTLVQELIDNLVAAKGKFLSEGALFFVGFIAAQCAGIGKPLPEAQAQAILGVLLPALETNTAGPIHFHPAFSHSS